MKKDDTNLIKMKERVRSLSSTLGPVVRDLSLALDHAASDPEAAAVKCGRTLESILTDLHEKKEIAFKQNSTLEQLLQGARPLLPAPISTHITFVRSFRNVGAHHSSVSIDGADIVPVLQATIAVAEWYARFIAPPPEMVPILPPGIPPEGPRARWWMALGCLAVPTLGVLAVGGLGAVGVGALWMKGEPDPSSASQAVDVTGSLSAESAEAMAPPSDGSTDAASPGRRIAPMGYEMALLGIDPQVLQGTWAELHAGAGASLSPFYLGQTEVTQALYAALMDTNPAAERRTWRGRERCIQVGQGREEVVADDFPVICVTWEDALRFCNALSAREGLTVAYRPQPRGGWLWDPKADGYRLPTAAEWDYAALAGGGEAYPVAGDAQVACAHGNVLTARSGTAQERVFPCEGGVSAGLAKVGSFQASRLGLHDLLGNVWEWTWDEEEGARIVRGGGWTSGPQRAQLRYPQRQPPDHRSDDLGFRVARSAR